MQIIRVLSVVLFLMCCCRFVRVLTNILLLIIILVLLCRSLLDGLLYFIFNMTGRAVGQRRNFMVLHSALFENVWVSIDMYAMSIGSVGR